MNFDLFFLYFSKKFYNDNCNLIIDKHLFAFSIFYFSKS